MSRAREFADLAGSADAGGITGRNIVINGAMQVAQRATSASAKSSAGFHVVDRFKFINNTSTGAVDIEQSTTVPAGQGFGYSLKVSTSTAKATLTGTNEFGIQQRIEGQNLQVLNHGTSSASKATLSFWVRSNKTGTYVVWFYKEGSNRNIQRQFTISSADTWEKKALTIDGDTSGSIANDNSNELEFFIVLGTGPDRSSGTAPTAWETLDNADRYVGQTVNILDSTSNTFYLTGVQLEIGEKATPFDHSESYGETLAKCQRYYFKFLEGSTKEIGVAWYYTAAHASFMLRYPTTMRATPTGIDTTGTGYYTIYRNGGSDAINSITFENGSTEQYSAYNNSEASGTAGQAWLVISTNASAKVEFDAEL